jgi:type II secretory pathway component PulF
MNMYRFQVVDRNGVKQNGSLFAYHRAEALHNLTQHYSLLLWLEEETWWKFSFASLQEKKLFTHLDLSLMCKQLTFLLQGGIPLREVLLMMISESKQSHHALFFKELVNAIEAGYRFSDSLERWGTRLPSFFVQSVRAGELSGHWEIVFRDLAEFYLKEHKNSQQRKQVMLYPILLLCITGLVCYFLLTIIMPNFMSLYTNGRVLPWPTRVLLQCYQYRFPLFLNLLIGLILLTVGIRKLLSTLKIQTISSKFILQLPQLGIFLIKQDLARFCRSFSLLLTHGLEINQCLPVCAKLLLSPYLKDRIFNISHQLNQGRGFSASMQEISIWPPVFLRMLQIGEVGNRLQETMADAATLYEMEVHNQIQTWQRMIEPSMIIVISLIIGFLAYAIMLPMMDQWQGYQMI